MTTNAVASPADPTFGKGVRKGPLIWFSLTVWLGAPAISDAQSDPARVHERDAFLSAVAEVETGGNTRAIGSRGERGLYQFTRATWQRHSSRSFFEAHNPKVAYVVAVQHYDWLRNRISASGREPSPYWMAVAWNAGLGRALAGSAPRSTRDYARRVSNLTALARPPVGPLNSAPVVQLAMNSAPVAPAASANAVPGSSQVVLSAPEVAPINFSLSRQDTFSLGPVVAEATPADASNAEDVSFKLAPAGETTADQGRRRFIFATIGE